MVSRLSRILVVDGCAATRETTNKSLRALGYTTIDYVSDGGGALKLLGQNNYRLVLADWDMTPIDGQKLLTQARLDRRLRCLPFLMAIDRWQRKFIEIVRDDGATLYLTKPFTTQMLGERIIQVDRDASQLKELQSRQTRSHDEINSLLWKYLQPPV